MCNWLVHNVLSIAVSVIRSSGFAVYSLESHSALWRLVTARAFLIPFSDCRPHYVKNWSPGGRGATGQRGKQEEEGYPLSLPRYSCSSTTYSDCIVLDTRPAVTRSCSLSGLYRWTSFAFPVETADSIHFTLLPHVPFRRFIRRNSTHPPPCSCPLHFPSLASSRSRFHTR